MSDKVLDTLVAWGERTHGIRAMILTSTRARADGPVDEFSDYDVIVVVTDPAGFAQGDLGWQAAYATPLVRWGDEDELYGRTTYFRGVIYEDQVKVDYSIWPDALLEALAEHETLPPGLDHGYRVLVDKDGRTRRWPQPTYTAYILDIPSEAEYRALVEEFWWGTTYAAKALRRGELFFANSFMLEHDLKIDALRRMLEWRIAVAHAWSFAPGVHGRGLERHFDRETLQELSDTYASLDPDETWTALFRLVELFRRVAAEVAAALGYAYPREIAQRMSAYLTAVRDAPRSIGGGSTNG
jgi:aminoglycoside 6-adenylyltransferase